MSPHFLYFVFISIHHSFLNYGHHLKSIIYFTAFKVQMFQSLFQDILQANGLIITEAHLFFGYAFMIFFIILLRWDNLLFNADNKTHSIYL